jgi:hypothetical protein
MTPDDRMFAALASAQAAALSYVCAVAKDRLNDEHGVSLHAATTHARACGATHAQVTAAMRQGE